MAFFRSKACWRRPEPTDALDLEYMVTTIKTLFLRRQYKRCASRSLQFLNDYESELHPVYRIFLLFFAGISNDCYARVIPIRSPLMPSTLNEAESYLTKAQELMRDARVSEPVRTSLLSHDSFTDDDSSCDSTSSSLDNSGNLPSRPSTAATSISPHSPDRDKFWKRCPESPSNSDYVSPLHIRKYQDIAQTPSKASSYPSTSLFSVATESPSDPPNLSRPNPRLASFYLLTFPSAHASSQSGSALPTATPQSQQLSSPPQTPRREDPVAWSDDRTYSPTPSTTSVYNNALLAFSSQITKHLHNLAAFRDQILNTPRPTTYSSFRTEYCPSPTEARCKMSAGELAERIVRGRERGWVRERFQPGRYRDLCELAISEL